MKENEEQVEEEVLEGAEAASDEEESADEQDQLPELEEAEKTGLIQALLFAHGEPMGLTKLTFASGLPRDEVKDALQNIEMMLEIDDSGFELCQVAGKYQLRTKEKFAPFMRKLKASRPKKLSGQALETLAIVAYRQPIVRSDVEKIRGVDPSPTLKTLLERGLIRIVGHRDSPGQPALYGTTDRFLKIFGLDSISQLPSLRDIKELEAEPGEDIEETEEAEGATEDGEALNPEVIAEAGEQLEEVPAAEQIASDDKIGDQYIN